MTRNLQAFLAVAEAGSLTAAAEGLHITQPSLTKRLQQLETAYGCALLERGARGTRLTAAGEVLLVHARRIDAERRQSFEAVAAENGRELGTLRIGAGPLFHLRYLAGALQALRTAFPELRVELIAGLNKHNLPRLKSGELDIVFGSNEGDFRTDGAVLFDAMTSVEQGIVVRSDHPVRQAHRLDAGTLKSLPWILYGDGPGDAEITAAFFRREGLEVPVVGVQTTSFTLGLQMVETSDAAMTTPIALAPFIEKRALHVLRTEPAMAVFDGGAFCRRATRRFAAVERLLDLVRDAVAPDGAAAARASDR